jgi:3-isopropylmalate/(R)-2-methylmalate dehydratase small subunit
MERFTQLTAQAVPVLEEDIDTDLLFPARFLLIMDREGLGQYLFHDRRHADPSFVLDRPEFTGAKILVTGMNFGCGSSREQAVWTLLGAGFRCVIAPGFGDIFYANCFKNGLLPIVLPQTEVSELATLAARHVPFDIDLETQAVRVGDRTLPFAIPAERREALLSGRDDVDRILLEEPAIAAFETRSRRDQPWLFAWDLPGIASTHPDGAQT